MGNHALRLQRFWNRTWLMALATSQEHVMWANNKPGRSYSGWPRLVAHEFCSFDFEIWKPTPIYLKDSWSPVINCGCGCFFFPLLGSTVMARAVHPYSSMASGIMFLLTSLFFEEHFFISSFIIKNMASIPLLRVALRGLSLCASYWDSKPGAGRHHQPRMAERSYDQCPAW